MVHLSLKVGKSTIIVLNDPQAIFELIHKEGNVFIVRPEEEHCDRAYHNQILSLTHSGEAYKARRKIVQHLLSLKNMNTTF